MGDHEGRKEGRKDACSITRLIISFTFKAFQVFCSHFSPPKEAKWVEKNLSKKEHASFVFFASNLSHNKSATQISCACWHTHPIPDTS